MNGEVTVILSKQEWEELLLRGRKTLTIFKETDLHFEFGDDPNDYIVRVKMTESSG
jgi:hypothetical protein